jgi:hypothetical protein
MTAGLVRLLSRTDEDPQGFCGMNHGDTKKEQE